MVRSVTSLQVAPTAVGACALPGKLPPAMGYDFEIFVSYRRSLHDGGPSGERRWVHDVFVPELRQRLAAEYPNPRVCLDIDLETGTVWPEALKAKLKASKTLVPVWSASYFRSAWCMSEWLTMRRREEILGLASGAVRGLVFPVIYGDGDFFADEAKATLSLRKFAEFSVIKKLRSSAFHERFATHVKDLCCDLARFFQTTDFPPFNPDWPFVDGKPLDEPPMPMGSMR